MSEEKLAQKSEQKIEENLPKDRVDLFPVFRTLYDLIIEFERAHAQLIVSALAQVGGLLKVEKKRSDKVYEGADRKNSKK